MTTPCTVNPSFGQQHFGSVNLGHKARNKSLIRLADLLHRHPGGTLPDKLAAPKDYKKIKGDIVLCASTLRGEALKVGSMPRTARASQGGYSCHVINRVTAAKPASIKMATPTPLSRG